MVKTDLQVALNKQCRLLTKVWVIVSFALTSCPPFVDYAHAEELSRDGFAGVAIWEGTVYLADTEKNVVLVMDPGGTKFQPFVSPPAIVAPRGLAVDRTWLYIADPVAHQVFRVNRESREITPLLPTDSAATPIDVATIPAFVQTDEAVTRLPSIAVLDGNSGAVFAVTPSRATDLFDSLSKRRFIDPRSISTTEGQILVSDYGAGTIFTATGSKDWVDIRRSGPRIWFSVISIFSRPTGFFFSDLKHPQSAVSSQEFVYVVDDHKLYAYLPSKGRLVRLAFRHSPPSTPDRIALNQTKDELYLAGARVEDLRVWPLLLPMTVEVAAGGDVSTPLAALYSYLWRKGFLPTTRITLPYTGISGEACDKPACIIERGRVLLPKTNVLMEQLLCDMNPDLCSGAKMKRFRSGDSILIPDIPFEPFLLSEAHSFDGKTTIRSYLESNVPDQKLLASVNEDYLKALNPGREVGLDSRPEKGVSLKLPVQRHRYYLSIDKYELFSAESELAPLVRQYPSLSIRPYGASSRSSVQSPDQEVIRVHDLQTINPIEKTVLDHIGFQKDHALKYGRANDVPVLIDEAALDCQHPVFFGTDREDHAFPGQRCAQSEPVSKATYVDWSESAPRHGTCVASIIGARSAPYGPGLAPGVELTWAETVSADSEDYIHFYKRVRQPFIVNVSSGSAAVTAESSWRNLLGQPLVNEDVLFVASADNDDDLLRARGKFPALLAREFPNVISVGALGKNGTGIWEDLSNQQGSNTGLNVEILAPGEAVPCAIEVSQGQAWYSDAVGTSFATPLVSAVAALLFDKRLSPAETKARILATADPIEGGRKGEPLALFGTLNIENALSNPRTSHIQFSQQGKSLRLDADILEQSRLNYKDLKARLPRDTPIASDDILAIRSSRTDAQQNRLYRLVWFNDSSKRVEVGEVALNGCLEIKERETGESYILSFGGGCPEAGELQDKTKVITELQLLIAPTLGAARFRK